MLLTVPTPVNRPLGWPVGLAGFGIPYRWVCIEGPVRLGKSKVVGLIKSALADYLESAAGALAASSAGREVAESIVEGVEQVRQPGALLAVPDGSPVNLRDLAGPTLPPAAQFGLYLADRVLQNAEALRLLETSSLVIQERGAFRRRHLNIKNENSLLKDTYI